MRRSFSLMSPYFPGFRVGTLEECVISHPVGFVGYFVRGDDEFHVCLPHSSREDAEEVLICQLGADFPQGEWNVQSLKGDFTYTDLEDWHGCFLGDWLFQCARGLEGGYTEIVALPGYLGVRGTAVIYSGTDVRLNRVVFVSIPILTLPLLVARLENVSATCGYPLKRL